MLASLSLATIAALQTQPQKPATQVSRRAVLAALPVLATTVPALAADDENVPYLSLPLSTRVSALHAELSPLAPLDYALQKQREKQEKCYDDGECADRVPYYAIECDRDDDYCLQRKRRMAAQEFANFQINPTSSPLFLTFVALPVLQWGIAAARITMGIINRNKPPPPDDPPLRRAPVQQAVPVPVPVPVDAPSPDTPREWAA